MLLKMNTGRNFALIAILFFLLCSVNNTLWGIEVNGNQTGTWTLNNSPYVVTGSIVIPNNRSLTIESGVVVKFAGYYSIKISGSLIAKGNVGKRIIFTSIHDKEFGITTNPTKIVPTNKDWQGIEFAPSSRESSKLDYCIIRYCDKVIISKFANPTLTHLIIADCNATNIILNGKKFVVQSGAEQNYVIPVTSTNTTSDRPPYEPEPTPQVSSLPSPIEQAKESVFNEEEFTFGELTVYSAARRAQKITQAPAAISVITEEDIKHSGAVTIPDVLRIVPGLDVMQITASDLVINARGYNKEMSNKMLVLIDGRYVYWDFYGIILWDSFPIVLEDIKRIEIIRGPGSALYGANAFSGVVNIITKSPDETFGTHVSATGGEINTYLGSVIHAGGTDKLSYKLSLGIDEINHWSDHSAPSRDVKRAKGVLQYKLSETSQISFEGGVSKGQGETLSGIGRMNRKQKMKHLRLNYNHSNLLVRMFWSRSRGDAIQEPSLNPYYFIANTYDLESQFLFNLGTRNSVIIGGNYRVNLAESDLIDQDHRQELMAVYVQDEFKLANNSTITLGLRYDDHPLVKEQITPRSNIIISPFKDHYLRLSYGTAFRSPSFIESYLYEDNDISAMISPLLPANTVVVKARGNSDLLPEKITSYEIGYQALLSPSLRAKVDLFYNNLWDFISFKTINYQDVSEIIGQPQGSVIVPAVKSYTNAGKSKATGTEIGLDFLAADWLLWTVNYSYQNLTWEEDDPGTPEDEKGQTVKTSPKNKLNCGLRFTFKNGISVNLQLHYVDQTEKYETWAYGKVEPYTLVNARIGYRFFNDRVEFALAVFNLFNKKHYEYPGFDSIGNPIGGHELGRRVTSTFLSYNF